MNLGRWSRAQWERVLPEKPGRVVWPHPDGAGQVKPSRLASIAAEIDKALDAFFDGAGSWRVTLHLALARRLIRGVPGDGDLDFQAYGRDQRPQMLNLLREIQEVLEILAQGDKDDIRWKLLNAPEGEVCRIDTGMGPVGPGFDGLVAALEADPRVWGVEWDSGYPYTTGESSGTAHVLAAEGATEMGFVRAQCLAADYPEISGLVARR
ncbi:hypothetical protein [Sagittula sp. S175]|uniref:hypothetical protein n=1 Tax=Sagittula sp. S175 TaxID=3415129 RepID=UPI003C7DE8C7